MLERMQVRLQGRARDRDRGAICHPRPSQGAHAPSPGGLLLCPVFPLSSALLSTPSRRALPGSPASGSRSVMSVQQGPEPPFTTFSDNSETSPAHASLKAIRVPLQLAIFPLSYFEAIR